MPDVTTLPSPPYLRLGEGEPRLLRAASWWSAGGHEQTELDVVEGWAAGGVEAIEVNLSFTPPEVLDRLVGDLGLTLIGQAQVRRADELDALVHTARERAAIGLNLQLGHAFLDDDATLALVDEVLARDTPELPMLLETHRGRLTQDPWRTRWLLTHRPDVRITLDVSHWLLASEGFGGSTRNWFACVEPALERTALIHGRISDGEAIQVDPAGDVPLLGHYLDVWSRAMRAFRGRAGAGDVFVFEPELGPPPYAPLDVDGRERWSRLAGTDRLFALAEQAWARSAEPIDAAGSS